MEAFVWTLYIGNWVVCVYMVMCSCVKMCVSYGVSMYKAMSVALCP